MDLRDAAVVGLRFPTAHNTESSARAPSQHAQHTHRLETSRRRALHVVASIFFVCLRSVAVTSPLTKKNLQPLGAERRRVTPPRCTRHVPTLRIPNLRVKALPCMSGPPPTPCAPLGSPSAASLPPHSLPARSQRPLSRCQRRPAAGRRLHLHTANRSSSNGESVAPALQGTRGRPHRPTPGDRLHAKQAVERVWIRVPLVQVQTLGAELLCHTN
jgi:hypothetical protein